MMAPIDNRKKHVATLKLTLCSIRK